MGSQDETLKVQSKTAADQVLVQSSCSSMIKLDVEVSEGESLDSQVLKAMLRESAAANVQARNRANNLTRSSQELAEEMLKNKSREDSTRVLASQIESLRNMQMENEMLTSQVRQTMQLVTNIEKTLRKKQAESQTELDILRIKYGNLKTNYRSVDMQKNFTTLN